MFKWTAHFEIPVRQPEKLTIVAYASMILVVFKVMYKNKYNPSVSAD